MYQYFNRQGLLAQNLIFYEHLKS